MMIWIAAIARHNDLILLTRDNHFEHVPALSMELIG
jgi:predicted nucleic acid-binding protein